MKPLKFLCPANSIWPPNLNCWKKWLKEDGHDSVTFVLLLYNNKEILINFFYMLMLWKSKMCQIKGEDVCNAYQVWKSLLSRKSLAEFPFLSHCSTHLHVNNNKTFAIHLQLTEDERGCLDFSLEPISDVLHYGEQGQRNIRIVNDRSWAASPELDITVLTFAVKLYCTHGNLRNSIASYTGTVFLSTAIPMNKSEKML
jgi:hypothetical protein